eukprot:TRINITY_DN75262_c0_g1_i1.p1 TRINITY_DN75262_c0_g1~~TRINITY_DN75262_c0_g1_i1.p1  ORF type:complete len:439 (-),score=97.28 TRINITY_DN75262_c0_g1_i1:80-1363(-)
MGGLLARLASGICGSCDARSDVARARVQALLPCDGEGAQLRGAEASSAAVVVRSGATCPAGAQGSSRADGAGPALQQRAVTRRPLQEEVPVVERTSVQSVRLGAREGSVEQAPIAGSASVVAASGSVDAECLASGSKDLAKASVDSWLFLGAADVACIRATCIGNNVLVDTRTRSSSENRRLVDATASAAGEGSFARGALAVGNAASKHPFVAVDLEKRSGLELFRNERFEEALLAFQRMRTAAADAELENEHGEAWRLIGNCLDKLEAPSAEVEDAYQKALKTAYRHSDMELSFAVLTGMGDHALRLGDNELAEHHHLQAQTLAQRVLGIQEQAVAAANLATCLRLSENRRSEAVEYFRKAIRLQTNSRTQVALRRALASTLAEAGNVREAAREFRTALAQVRTAGDTGAEADILSCLERLPDVAS